MRPIDINGEKYFPQPEKLLSMLKKGDTFKTKNGTAIYTIDSDGEVIDSNKNVVAFPSKMPVTPLKKF